jgi:hypothetical protein
MTTLLIDDELSRRAQRAAAAQGKTLDDFVRDALQQAIGVSISMTERNGLPVVNVSPPIAIDPRDVRRAWDENCHV